ncbi:hypothetical protein ALC57_10762 [Trachymyrmex cornetzi]|uniref:Uncharacterized protein n=1 Tax=Trachymyrmex cornetzi TaxID=471704 RepID=A0A151J3G3_9HYME|nr:hypothetical protein ALC57_10762 [Trachymyrmex cornetzi]
MGKASSSCIAASLLRRSEADYDLEDSGSRGVLTQAINNSPGGRAIICLVTSITRLYIRFRNTETTMSPVLEAIRRSVTTPAYAIEKSDRNLHDYFRKYTSSHKGTTKVLPGR